MILRGAFCLGSFSLRLSTKYQKYFEKLSLLSAFIKWFAFIALHKQFIPQLLSYTFTFPFVTVKCIICLSFVLCPHCLLSIEWNSARLGDPAHAKQIINYRQKTLKSVLLGKPLLAVLILWKIRKRKKMQRSLDYDVMS